MSDGNKSSKKPIRKQIGDGGWLAIILGVLAGIFVHPVGWAIVAAGIVMIVVGKL